MPDRTLVVGPSWVGDMVMAQSLFKLLRGKNPTSLIDVLAPGWSLGVLDRMPEVSKGIELPVGHGELGIGKRRRVAAQLKGQYEKAIVLPRSAKSALVPWFASIPLRVGFLGEVRYGLINDRRERSRHLDQTVKRFCALGMDPDEKLPHSLPQPSLRVDLENQERLKEALSLGAGSAAVGLLPGAEYGPAKQWPPDRFKELGALLAERGYQVWVLGSKKEWELGEELRGDRDDIQNLCGRTTLADAIDLLAACEAVVTNDSGLMHIASAVGTHVVGIYGSSSPRFTPPLTDRKTIIWRDLDCSPCFERECPLAHLNCLREISVAEVFSAVGAA